MECLQVPDFVLGPSFLQWPETPERSPFPPLAGTEFALCLPGFGMESTVNSQLSMQMEWNVPLIIQKEQRVHK